MSNYPPGSDTEDAPWNVKDPHMVTCAQCDGEGFYFDENNEEHTCPACDGSGEIENDSY